MILAIGRLFRSPQKALKDSPKVKSPRETDLKKKNISSLPAVESLIAVEDAIENRFLYRVFIAHLFFKVSDTVAPQSCS